MKPTSLRWWAPLALGGLVLASLTGCVYLRLLEIKKQLQNFDQNFSIGGRTDLEIELKFPVLREKDVDYLIGGKPFSIEGTNESIYHYEFDMVRSSATPDRSDFTAVVPSSATALPPLHHLSLQLGIKDGKMNKIVVPETFMLLFPRGVLVETLKSAANAEVYETKRMARARIQLPLSIDADLPSQTKTLFLLGEPFATESEGDGTVLLYRYRISHVTRPVPIFARLSFDAKGLLRRVRVRWDTSTVEAIYDRD